MDLNGRGGGGLGVGEGHLVRRGLAILADLDGLAAGGLEGVAVHHLAVFHHVVRAHGQVYRHGARHYAAALGHVFKGDGGGHGGLLRVGKHHGDGRAAAVHGEGLRVGAGVEVALRRGRGIAFGAVAFSRRRDLHSAVRHQGLAVRVHMVERHLRGDEVLGVGERDLHRGALAVHLERFGIGAGVGVALHSHLIAGSAVGVGRKLLLGIGGNGRAVCVHMVERYDGVDHLRRILGIVQRHLNGGAAAVHGEGFRVCARIGVALHRRLIAGGAVGVGGQRLLGVAGDGLAVAQMVEGHHRVKLLHDLRIVQRHLNGRAAAVHGEGLGARARVGVALHRRLIIGRIVGVGRKLLLRVAGDGRAVAQMVEGDDGIHRLRLLGRVGKDDRFRLHGAVVVHDDLLHVDLQGIIPFGRVDGKFVDGVAAGVAFKCLRLRHGLLRLVHIDGADGALHRLLLLGEGEHNLRRGQRAVGIRGHLHAGLAHKRVALRLVQVHLDGHAAALCALGGGGVERLAGGLIHVFDGHLHVQVLLHLLLGEQAEAVVPHIAVRSVVVDPIPAFALLVKALDALGRGHDDILVHALNHSVVLVLDGRAGAQVQAALGGDAVLVGVLLQHHGLGGRVRVVIQRHVNGRARPVHHEGLLGGRGVGIAFNLRLVVRGGIGIRRKLLLRAGQLLIGGGVLVMERHRRVHRLRRVLRVVQRHFHRRARPIHVKAHGVRALEGIAVDADGVRRRIIRSRRKTLRGVIGKGQASVAGVPVMERHGRVHRFRRILRIVQRHLDGRTGPVRREALRIRRRVGIPLHLHLVDRGIGLHARGRFFRGVAGDLLICVLVQMMDRHNRVHRFRRARRIVQRHLDGRAHAVRRKALRVGIGVGVALHLRLVDGGIGLHVCLGFRRGVAGDRLTGLRVHMMDRHRRVHRLRRILRIVQRHLDGRAHAVRRKALRVGIGVGVALHLRLVDGGIGLHVCLCLRSGVTGDLLAGLRVHMMGRHRRVHHLRRARRIVQRHLDRRTRSIHGKGVGGGIRIGISLHRLLIGGRAVGFGGQLLPGIAGDLLSGHLIEMMEGHRGIDHLRRALLHLKHHGIGAGGAVGVERHKHLAGADELVARRYQRGIRRKAAPLCRHRIVKAVNFVARKAVGDMHRAAGGADRLIRRHGNHGQIQRIGDFKGAVAPYLDTDGRNAVHRRGIAIDRRADGRRIRHHRGLLHSGDTADGHAGLQRLFRHGSPIDHLIAIEGGRNGSALHALVRKRRPLQRYGRQHADILRQSGHGQHQLRRDEQHAGDKRQHPPESSGNMLCHIDILLRCN